ncbi:MAG: bifunctional metallophosphatase/5'-nucleotidase [bacterium]|nr:bifunctional metallophosphatase/5'-nucleotidase [bacterium]
MKTAKALILPALLAAAVSVALAGGPADPVDDGVLRLHLLWTNDVHGHIAPEPARFMNPEFPPPLGGAASAASYIKEVRRKAAAAGEEVLLVDVGDFFQGTPIGSKTQGTSVMEYFNAIGYDLGVPGNHDFDMGRVNCERLLRMSEFPWVCANLRESATGEPVDWVQPTLMLEFQGVKIGVVGIITPSTASMSFPQNIEGLEFLPMPETIEEFRDKLLDDGADIIFLAIHEGLPYDPEEGWKRLSGTTETETTTEQQGIYGSNHSYGGMDLMELVHHVPGIDFAVGGHTHRGYHEPWIDPVNHTMCFESYGNGSSVGHAVLLVDKASGTLLGWEPADARGTLITLFEDEIWPDEETTALIRPHHEATQAAMLAVVGQTASALGRGGPGSNLVGNLVTDAMIDYFDADFSFQNMGGLRADMPGGDITAGDIFAVLPFGNELVEVRMDGRMVRRVIERKLRGRSGGICVGGVQVTFDQLRPDYDRVVDLKINGEPWDPDRIYKVIVTSFLMEGNSGLDFLTQVPATHITPTRITTAECVERYLERYSPVRPRVDDRWVEVPGASQAEYLAKPYLPESVQ